MTTLNLGAGNDIMEGAINHDITLHRPEIDIAWDLNKVPWPWLDGTFDLVVAKSVLEHLDHDLMRCMDEVWRVLKPGGTLYIKLPFWNCDMTWSDPTHRRGYGIHIFDQFDPSTERGKEYSFYTPHKWEIVKGPRLNRSRTSILCTLKKRPTSETEQISREAIDMTRIDNDPTKGIAKPFVLIAHVRSGGTMLAHVLSDHPEIHCDRGESLHHLSLWRRQLPHVEANRMLHILLHQEGYLASGCRLNYTQAFHQRVWRYLVKQGVPVIHLTRENHLRQGISFAYHQAVRGKQVPYHPVHTFVEVEPPQVELSPEYLLGHCRQIAEQEKRARKRLEKFSFEVLDLSYADLTGGEGTTVRCIEREAASKICEFLGVRVLRMCCDLKRVHGHPLHAWFTNWAKIEKAIEASEFAAFLEDEKWRLVDGRWAIRAGPSS